MKRDLIFLLPIAIFLVATIWAITTLTEIQETIMERIHTPINVDVIPDYINKDLTCHKVGLYTDWDEGFGGGLGYFLTGINVGEHARQMFFEYDCSLTCHKSTYGTIYWQSDKVCIAELYPHD